MHTKLFATAAVAALLAFGPTAAPAFAEANSGPTPAESGTRPDGTASEKADDSKMDSMERKAGDDEARPTTSDTGTSNAGNAQVSPSVAAEADMPADAMTAKGFASMAAMSDMYEIEAGKLASTQSQDKNVKALADMIVADHTASTEELTNIAKGMGASLPSELDAAHKAKIDQLMDTSAGAFDRVWLDQQITAHQKALSMLQAYAQKGDNAELQAFATKVTPKVQMHLAEAQKLRDTMKTGMAD